MPFRNLEEPSAALTLNDVMEPARASAFRPPTQPNSAALGFSYTRSAVWLRLPLSNSSKQPLLRVLEINYALLAQIDFYAPDAQGTYQVTQTGYADRLQTAPCRRASFFCPYHCRPSRSR